MKILLPKRQQHHSVIERKHSRNVNAEKHNGSVVSTSKTRTSIQTVLSNGSETTTVTTFRDGTKYIEKGVS